MRPIFVLFLTLLLSPHGPAAAGPAGSCRLPGASTLGASQKLYRAVFVPPETVILFSVADRSIYEIRRGGDGLDCRLLHRARSDEMRYVSDAVAARDATGAVHVAWIESLDGENARLALLRAASGGGVAYAEIKTAPRAALRGTPESGIRLHVLGPEDDLVFYSDASETHFDWINLDQLPYARLRAVRYVHGAVRYDQILSDRGKYGVGPYEASVKPDGSFDLVWATRSSWKDAYTVFVQSFSAEGEPRPKNKKKKIATVEQQAREWQEGSPPTLDLRWLPDGNVQAAADTGGNSLPVLRLDVKGETVGPFLLGGLRPWGLDGCTGDGEVCLQRFFDTRDPKRDVLRRRLLSRREALDQEVVFPKNVLVDNRVLLLQQEPGDCYAWLETSRAGWRLVSRCFSQAGVASAAPAAAPR